MRNLLQISGISNILNMFNIHIVNRFLEGVMARSTNSSKKNTTTTKKAEAVKTVSAVKENVTENDKNVTKTNEDKKEAEKATAKETEKVTAKETEKTEPKKVAKKPVEKKEAVKEPEATKEEAVKADTKAVSADTKKESAQPAPKKRGRKPGSKNKQKEQLTPEVYVQYHGEEAEQSAIIEKIKEQYVSEGHRAGNIKSLKLYLKPEDRAAYFVINDRYAGKVDLFNF